jgi:hypothetical protein
MGTTAKVMGPVPGAPDAHYTYGHFRWLQDEIARREFLLGDAWRDQIPDCTTDVLWRLLSIDPTNHARSAIPGAYGHDLANRLERIAIRIDANAGTDEVTVRDAMLLLAHMAREAAESGGLIWWN